MPLIVETPKSHIPEREYVLNVVLTEFLGVDWVHKSSQRRNVRITQAGHPRSLTMPDQLLSVTGAGWLNSVSLPRGPLATWDSRELGRNIALTQPTVPVIYGNPTPAPERSTETIFLPIDIFGSAFFMLTRYEEHANPERDKHDRFPASASLAFKEDFLARPIIDEYVEILWAALTALWPSMVRKERRYTLRVSHDVDLPSRYKFGSMLRFVRSVAGDVAKRGDFGNATRAPFVRWASKTRLHPDDPYNTFDWIMDASDETGLTSAFYFKSGCTDPRRDADYRPEHPTIRYLLRRIHQRGHEIGLHPSYNTYKNPDAISAEAMRLRKVCSEESILQDQWGGRMHYLRWHAPLTPRGLEQAGMAYDSTLGFADQPGFRCGTCLEYPAFDLLARKPLKLRIRPLVAMEGTVLSPKYLGLGASDKAYETFNRLKRACKIVRGNFTLLWHNSELSDPAHRSLYNAVISR